LRARTKRPGKGDDPKLPSEIPKQNRTADDGMERACDLALGPLSFWPCNDDCAILPGRCCLHAWHGEVAAKQKAARAELRGEVTGHRIFGYRVLSSEGASLLQQLPTFGHSCVSLASRFSLDYSTMICLCSFNTPSFSFPVLNSLHLTVSRVIRDWTSLSR
jgi:hypothetical protein